MWEDDDSKFGMSTVATSFEQISESSSSASPDKYNDINDVVINPPLPPTAIEYSSSISVDNFNGNSSHDEQAILINKDNQDNLCELKIKHSGILEKRSHFRSTWKTCW